MKKFSNAVLKLIEDWPIVKIDIDHKNDFLAIGQNSYTGAYRLSIWDCSKHVQIFSQIEKKGHISTLSFIPGYDLLCVITNGKDFNLLDLTAFETLKSFTIENKIRAISFRKNIVILMGTFLEIWDWTTEKKLWPLDKYQSGIITEKWDYNDLNCSWEYIEKSKNQPYFNRPAWALHSSNENEIFLSGNNTANIQRYNWRENKTVKIINDAPLQMTGCSNSKNMKYMCVAGVIPDGDFLFDVNSGERMLTELFNERFGASKISCFHPNEKIIARGFHYGHVLLNYLETGETVYKDRLHKGDVNSICFTSNGQLLYSAGADGRLNVITLKI